MAFWGGASALCGVFGSLLHSRIAWAMIGWSRKMEKARLLYYSVPGGVFSFYSSRKRVRPWTNFDTVYIKEIEMIGLLPGPLQLWDGSSPVHYRTADTFVHIHVE